MKNLCALVIGHKKSSPGAMNARANLAEFDFNEKLACKIEVRTVRAQIQRVYRRTYDLLPDDINELEPDFTVSLHCNAFNERASGTEVLYYHKSTKGERLARILLKHLVNHLKLPDRGIRPRTTEDRGGYLLRYTKAPCVIAEPFFIDNDHDLARAQEDLDGLATAYARAIDEFCAEISAESSAGVPVGADRVAGLGTETELRPLSGIPSAGTEKLYGGYDLKRGDMDNDFVYAGSVRSGDAGDALPGQGRNLYVQQLQRDLMTLGFRIVGEASGIFNLQTEWAVREFQIYGKMEYVACEDPDASGGYVSRLSQVENPAAIRYDGPVSGIVNEKTRSTLQHWLTNNWRCPVVVAAWNMASGNRTTIYRGDGENGENIWLHRDAASTAPRMYVRDFSNYYDTSAMPSPNDLIVLGDYAKYSNWSGPRSVPPRHTWAEAEMLPEYLLGAVGSMSPSQRSTYKVVRAVSEVECLGFFDCVNSYDNAFVSLGPCHWTLGIVNSDNSVSEGELCGYLAYLRSVDQAAFHKAIEFFGVRIDEDWGGNGQSLFSKSQCKYTGWVALQGEDGDYTRMDADEKQGDYFKSWHWFYRFVMAGRTIDGFRRRMWDMARMRLRDILAAPWPTGMGMPAIPDEHGGTRPANIGDVYTSERAIAMILRWHVRFPSYVIHSGRAGSKLQDAFRRAVGSASMSDPTGWTDADEIRLIEGIVDQVDDIGNQGLIDTIDAVYDWPAWANGRNPRGYRLNSAIGSLAIARKSFQFDDSDLPPAPVYT